MSVMPITDPASPALLHYWHADAAVDPEVVAACGARQTVGRGPDAITYCEKCLTLAPVEDMPDLTDDFSEPESEPCDHPGLWAIHEDVTITYPCEHCGADVEGRDL